MATQACKLQRGWSSTVSGRQPEPRTIENEGAAEKACLNRNRLQPIVTSARGAPWPGRVEGGVSRTGVFDDRLPKYVLYFAVLAAAHTYLR